MVANLIFWEKEDFGGGLGICCIERMVASVCIVFFIPHERFGRTGFKVLFNYQGEKEGSTGD